VAAPAQKQDEKHWTGIVLGVIGIVLPLID
jgi:hypothetical protein